jgi:site-specific recombinase XerD
VATTTSRIRAVLKKGRVARASELNPSVVHAAIDALRQPGAACQRGLNGKTASHYIAAIKAFSKWMARDQRMRFDCLAHLRGFNSATDQRRFTRDLSQEELELVIIEALHSPRVTMMRNGERTVSCKKHPSGCIFPNATGPISLPLRRVSARAKCRH